MSTWFDESRLDDERVLAAADRALRRLAESGARVRREAGDAAEATAEAVARASGARPPRAVIAAGPDSRLLRAVLEPWCPVPFVAWPDPALPGLGRQPRPGGRARARRVRPSAPPPRWRRPCAAAARSSSPARRRSLVAEHAAGRWSTTVLPTSPVTSSPPPS